MTKTARSQYEFVIAEWRTGPGVAPGMRWARLRTRTSGFVPFAHAQSHRSATVYRTETRGGILVFVRFENVRFSSVLL